MKYSEKLCHECTCWNEMKRMPTPFRTRNHILWHMHMSLCEPVYTATHMERSRVENWWAHFPPSTSKQVLVYLKPARGEAGCTLPLAPGGLQIRVRFSLWRHQSGFHSRAVQGTRDHCVGSSTSLQLVGKWAGRASEIFFKITFLLQNGWLQLEGYFHEERLTLLHPFAEVSAQSAATGTIIPAAWSIRW